MSPSADTTPTHAQPMSTAEQHRSMVDWKAIATRRQKEINDAIPAEYMVLDCDLTSPHLVDLRTTCGLLTAKELEITALSATKLLTRIHNGTYTAVEVTKAFCKTSAIAHQATNCLAYVMFNQAIADAMALDEFMSRHGRPKGPLHGLPISIKEHVEMRNTPATSGLIAWADNISTADALIVDVLRQAGAVFHVKTTNPQSLMMLETVSNLYGTTKNPHNVHLTSGGSTGGEAALIAMRGSLLGVGTDIGGSIRVPSAFCGIFGLKPSVARLPHGGLSGLHAGMETIIGCVGPMATCNEDLRLFCSVVLASEPWLREPSLVELPWKEDVAVPARLRIGVLLNDGNIQPHPPISRCLENTVQALRDAGHEVVQWDASLHKELVQLIDEAYFLDGGEEYFNILRVADEPLAPLIQWILAERKPRQQALRETWQINKRRNDLQTAYAALWNAACVDAIICPANVSVASAHGESKYWGYSSVWNILDYSSVVFPVGHVMSTDTWQAQPRLEDLSPDDALFMNLYTGPEKYAKAPVNLQLVTRRYREEQLLGLVDRVQECLKKHTHT